MKTLNKIFAAAAVAVGLSGLATSAFASGGGGARIDKANINLHDAASLQRGARLFANYCLNCHSAQYMRFNRLRDIGLNEDQIRDNLVFPGTLIDGKYKTAKVGETMSIAMDKADAARWFGAAPPDLSVISRSRGSDWLYTYLRSFYRDESRPTGWNNLTFPNVGMPHVLWELSGQGKLKVEEFADHHAATAKLLQTHTVAALEEHTTKSADGKEVKKYLLKTVEAGGDGKLDKLKYDEAAADLVNYLTFMGEPARNERTQIGILVLIGLGILFAVSYFMKSEYWKDIK